MIFKIYFFSINGSFGVYHLTVKHQLTRQSRHQHQWIYLQHSLLPHHSLVEM